MSGSKKDQNQKRLFRKKNRGRTLPRIGEQSDPTVSRWVLGTAANIAQIQALTAANSQCLCPEQPGQPAQLPEQCPLFLSRMRWQQIKMTMARKRMEMRTVARFAAMKSSMEITPLRRCLIFIIFHPCKREDFPRWGKMSRSDKRGMDHWQSRVLLLLEEPYNNPDRQHHQNAEHYKNYNVRCVESKISTHNQPWTLTFLLGSGRNSR